MKKKSIAFIAIVVCGMLAIGPIAHTNASDVQDTSIKRLASDELMDIIEMIPDGDGGNFYQCMILCGLPYVIIVAALAFAGQGMGAAQALLLAGATAAMIGCVLNCLGGGGFTDQSQECPCQYRHDETE